MTERQKQLIEGYIPNPRDRSLENGEYYLLYYGRGGERIRKVYIREILPHSEGYSSWNEYGVYDSKTNARIDSGWNSPFRGHKMADLYDNKEDCKNQTHVMYDGWEELRKIQEREG